MSFWEVFDSIAGPLDIGDRVLGLIAAIRHGNYRAAGQHGPVGIAHEVARSAVGSNIQRFTVPRGTNFNFLTVRRLLGKYGIAAFGRTYDAKYFYFSVKKRQARWAEYVMLNAGVELANPTFDRRNPGYVGRHGPGWMPTPWAEKEREPSPVSPAVEAPGAKATSSLDRLSRWIDDLLAD